MNDPAKENEISDAVKKVEEAIEILQEIWERRVSVRTPRMADAASLLERSLSKLKKEAAVDV